MPKPTIVIEVCGGVVTDIRTIGIVINEEDIHLFDHDNYKELTSEERNAFDVKLAALNDLISQKDSVSTPEPDPDLEYDFSCEECDTKAKWSMNNVVCAGTPICENCGDDMELV